MTFLKYLSTISSVWGKGLCFIVTSLLLVGCSEDSATTNVATVGPMPEATAKIIGLPSSACIQWMKLNVRQEITASTVSTSPCRGENLLSTPVTWTSYNTLPAIY